MDFNIAYDTVLGKEAGYSNDPRDSGGTTKYGITEAVARAFGYTGPMNLLGLDQAKAIYRSQYWDALQLDQVASLAPAVAGELFDTAVNLGAGQAATFLQRALSVLNKEASWYPDVQADGRIGPMTIATLREYIRRRGAEGQIVLMRALNALQGAFYVELAERRAKDEAFVYGWLLNRVEIPAAAAGGHA
jgi:lysozyme family protein